MNKNIYMQTLRAASKHTNLSTAASIARREASKHQSNHISMELSLTGQKFIKKADDGRTFIEGILTDNKKDTEGWSFSDAFMKKITEQINNKLVDGFISHKEFDEMLMKYSHLDEEVVVEKLRNERIGIFDDLKAIYEKGKVWVKGFVKNEFVDMIKNIKRMSIEVISKFKYQNQKTKTYEDGDVVGIALDNKARNTRAVFEIKKK